MLDNPLPIFECPECRVDIVGDYCPRCLSIEGASDGPSCIKCKKPINKNNKKGIHQKCAREMRGNCSKCDKKLYKSNTTGICRSCVRGKLPTNTCIADGCSNQTYSQTGYCSTDHHQQAAWVRQKEAKAEWFAQQPEDNITDAVIRYALRTNQDLKLYEVGKTTRKNDCLLWNGAKSGKYGMFGVSVKEATITFAHPVLVHRLSYAMVNDLPPSQSGPRADTLTINHKCFETLCINPAHLEVMTQSENSIDGKRNKETKSCARCSAVFDGVVRQIYCGSECRWKAQYERNKAKVA